MQDYVIVNENVQKIKGARVKSLIKKLTLDKINKLESMPIQGLSDEINALLNISNFKIIRKRLGKILSLEGKGAYIILPYKDSYILDVMSIDDYSAIGKEEIEIIGRSGKTYIYENCEYPIITKLYFDNNKPTLTRYIEVIDEKDNSRMVVTIEEDFVYDNIDFLPAKIFSNNAELVSDICEASVWDDLQRLEYFDNKLRAEWERTRTTPIYNSNFTDKDGKSETNAIDNGQGFIEDESFGAKLGQGMVMVPATAGTTILQQNIIFMEDDILKKLGMQRDTLNNGSNNHNLEIVMSNQYGLEKLLTQRDIRQSDYNDLFIKLYAMFNLGQAPTIELEISPIENAKLRLLDATVLEAETKAANLRNQNDAQVAQEEE